MGLILTKVSTPSSPSANTLDLFYDTTLSKLCAVDQSGNVAQLAGFTTKDYRLIRVVNYTSGNNTHTPTAGTKAISVECWGGGGAGGGAASSTAGTNNSVGGGGGAGAYSSAFLTGTLPSAGTTYDANVGAGGTAATAGNNAGGTGNDTVFRETTGATNKCLAKGGVGGSGGGVSAITLGLRGAGGAGGAAASGVGDIKYDGGAGTAGVVFSVVAATGMISGEGGDTAFGGIGGASLNTSGASSNASGAGGGSAGSCDAATTNRSSGTGSNGLIRIWEFG